MSLCVSAAAFTRKKTKKPESLGRLKPELRDVKSTFPLLSTRLTQLYCREEGSGGVVWPPDCLSVWDMITETRGSQTYGPWPKTGPLGGFQSGPFYTFWKWNKKYKHFKGENVDFLLFIYVDISSGWTWPLFDLSDINSTNKTGRKKTGDDSGFNYDASKKKNPRKIIWSRLEGNELVRLTSVQKVRHRSDYTECFLLVWSISDITWYTKLLRNKISCFYAVVCVYCSTTLCISLLLYCN